MKTSTIALIFGVSFAILNYLDAVLTLWLVQVEGGYHIELNPLIRWLMESMGNWFLLPKIAVGVIIAILIMTYWHKYSWFRKVSAGVTLAYFFIVVVHILSIVGVSL